MTESPVIMTVMGVEIIGPIRDECRQDEANRGILSCNETRPAT